MKKLFNYLFFATVLSLSSCQDYSPVDITAREISYNKNFINAFGRPSDNHSFGFINQPILDYSNPNSTRTVNTNSNQWADPQYYALNVPADVTQEESDYVYNWFLTHKNPKSSAIHWSDFFIQYVASYNEVNGSTERNMDQLGYEGILTSWEHVNNFNTTTHAIQYVYNAGTENWTYRASHSNTYQYDKYNIQYLSFDVNGNHYEGWYVAFDYESIVYEGDGSLESNSKFADGYYNDWIVKVSPGTHQGYPITVRVMCEDLGYSYDWDFNDVVFDVSFRKDEEYWPVRKTTVYATIVLQAAGGTMPIYVGTTDSNFEAHRLLGGTPETPIINPDEVAIYTIVYDGEFNDGNVANAKNIPIYVNGNEATYQINNTSIPQKFACPDNVEWSDECIDIRVKHPKFPDWIIDEDSKDVWTIGE